MNRRGNAWLIVIVSVSAFLAVTGAVQAQDTTKTLRVSTREVAPFVLKKDGKYSGFSAELWDAIAERIKVKYNYIDKNSVAEMIQSVKSGEADLSVAAISITSERDKEFDFSQPIFNAGLQIMVRDQSGGPTLVQAIRDFFSADVMKLIGIICVLVLIPAHLIWLVERKHEEKGIVETRRYVPGIFKAIWWSAATLSTQADEMPKTYVGRLIAIIWMFTSVVFIAYFTAQITSSLTVKQLQGTIQGPNDLPGKSVATVAGSTSETYLKDKNANVRSFARIEDAIEALDSKQADAVVYDAPVLLYYTAHEGKGKTAMVGSIFKSEGYGILFPPNSPWRKPVNQALLTLRENGTYDQIYNKWFGEGDK